MAERSDKKIAFQGLQGAYSDMACRGAYPDLEPFPCSTFEETFAAVEQGRAAFAMIPIENSIAGRVADIHRLLPGSKLHIIGEHFQPVNHHLLGCRGGSVRDLTEVHSHMHALAQCRSLISGLGIKARVVADTAGAAAEISKTGDKRHGAIASRLAAEIYDLDILRENVEDAEHNTTRFAVMSKEPIDPNPEDGPIITTFVFEVRNIPAALYKALGGFATNGVNMLKLESYLGVDSFTSARFYADVAGHPTDTSVRLALEELGFFSRTVTILGVYFADSYRNRGPQR
ncbi:MAG: prephenate dehydratase [Rhodospirillaceae bacterium]|nr:prephenate dehydratase [Rhodospirillaceae bacterium]